MFKKAFVMTAILGICSTQLLAKPPHADMDVEWHSKAQARADRMAEFLELDDAQQALFEVVIEAKMDAQELKHDGRQLKKMIFMGYTSGQMNKREIRQRAEAMQLNALNTHQNAFNAHMDFLASLNDEQREKLLSKVTMRNADLKSKAIERSETKGMDKMDKMSDFLALNAEQQALLEQLKLAKQDVHTLHIESHFSRIQTDPLLLKGEITEAELQSRIESFHLALVSAQTTALDAMFEWVDSLSDEQKQQLNSKSQGQMYRPQRSGRPSPHR